MAKKISWSVPMRAFGKARPRVTRRGTFMPHAYQTRRDALRWQSPRRDLEELRPPFRLQVTAVRQMPQSWSKKKRQQQDGEFCTAGPDVDNIIGAVMDALWEKDHLVVAVVGEKRWGREHELRIEVIGE